MNRTRPLAIITGASTGIGFELAKCCARDGYDLLIAANEPRINDAAGVIRRHGANVETVEADLSTFEGVDKLVGATNGRPVAALIANAGRGLGKGFLDQGVEDIMKVVNTNVSGTIYLIHCVGRQMRDERAGRILIVGSIAGFLPGTYQAVYNASKAFLDSFSQALRAELRGSGVSVTCLMPGATETDFFERAGMLDTAIGRRRKDDPADVARVGYEAMMRGDGQIVAGWQNKLQAAVAHVMPASILAEQHRKQAQPGSASP